MDEPFRSVSVWAEGQTVLPKAIGRECRPARGPEVEAEMAVIAPEARPVTPSRTVPVDRSPRRSRHSILERLSLNLVLGVVAALLAFVVAASLLADRRQMTTVAVANVPIAAGTAITPSMIDREALPTKTGFAPELLPAERIDAGLVAARTIQAGEPLTASAVRGTASVTPRRVMSIPLKTAQAANGQIDVGDLVDVIATGKDGASTYVLQGAEVVDRSSADRGGGLVTASAGDDFVISVELGSDQALELASAIASGSVAVVRSTGVTDTPPTSSGEGT
jgi:Flp pilus assembly protein CpaB